MKVRVYTRPLSHDYDVVIEPGLLDHLDEQVHAVAPAHTYALILDSNLAPLYGSRARAALERTRARVLLLDFPAGERSKSVSTWAALSDRLTAAGLSRDACIVALGGGVTGDLAGFVAATYMRGVPVVQVPTSLLAMIDASIGGKTGVDTSAGKNLVGAFHQPRAVLIDPQLLRTLPDHQLRFGLAEAVKHGAIGDAEYLDWIRDSVASIFEHKTHTVTSLIARSVEIKAEYVSADVHESGARAALNFGHTIAHAIEAASDYSVSHGDAVAVGMIVEAAAGEMAGITEEGTQAHLARVLEHIGLPIRLPRVAPPDAVIAATRSDKKTRADTQRYTLLQHVGAVARDAGWTAPLSDDLVREALTRFSD